MSKISSFFSKDIVLKIVSLILAIFVWLYIVNVAEPRITREYSDIPVVFNYEGSTPYNNNLMPLLASNVFTVNVKVSGPRTSFVNFSKEKISAGLNMNSVAAEGTYNIPLSVSVSDNDLTCEIIGNDYVTMEFCKKNTKTFDISLIRTGDYASGYKDVSDVILTPSHVTVSGPENIVKNISSAVAKVSIVGLKESFETITDISLVDKNGDPIDRTHLTLDVSQVYAKFTVGKSVPVEIDIQSRYGRETYFETKYSADEVLLQGDPDTLDSLSVIKLSPAVFSEEIKNEKTYSNLTPVIPSNVQIANNVTYISATVKLNKDVSEKSFTLKADQLKNCNFVNVPNGFSAVIQDSEITFKARSLSIIINSMSADQFILEVDLDPSLKTDKGYPIKIALPSNQEGGLLSQYYVHVNLTENK